MTEKDLQVDQVDIINYEVKSVYIPTMLCFHYSKKKGCIFRRHKNYVQVLFINYRRTLFFFFFNCMVRIYTLKKGRKKGVDWDNIPEMD